MNKKEIEESIKALREDLEMKRILEEEDKQIEKIRDWYWPLFHPICNIIDENGKIVAVDIEDVKLDLERVDP